MLHTYRILPLTFNKMKKKLVVISSGSIKSIYDRNSLERLKILSFMGGFFSQVDYFFYRTLKKDSLEVQKNLKLYDISGEESQNILRNIPLVRKIGAFAAGYAEIRALVDKIKPDLIWVVDPYISGLLGYRLSKRLNVPLVVNLVSDYELSYKVSGLKGIPILPASVSFNIETFVLKKANMVITDCDYYKQYAIRRGAKTENVKKIPRFVDCAYHNAEVNNDIWKELGINDESPLVYVGRLSPEKYCLDLIKAFVEILKVYPQRHLVVIGGEGLQKEEFLEKAKKLKLIDKIHIIKNLSLIQIKSAMAKAGVLLVTHGGYALLEAGFSGAAVVAYNYEWHPELIENDITGKLVPYRDAKAMAGAAVELMNDPVKTSSMQKQLHEKSINTYNIDSIITMQVNYIKALFDK